MTSEETNNPHIFRAIPSQAARPRNTLQAHAPKALQSDEGYLARMIPHIRAGKFSKEDTLWRIPSISFRDQEEPDLNSRPSVVTARME